jgi:hypothetical protein
MKMKNLLTIAGVGWIIYALYKNQQQDKEIADLKMQLQNANNATMQPQSKSVQSNFEVSKQVINPKADLFPNDIMVQKFDASKNATTSPALTQVIL